MSHDARDALAAIAARAGARTKPTNLSYRGIHDNFERRSSFKQEGIPIDAYANPTHLYIRMRKQSGVLFATPRRDPVLNVGILIGQIAGRDVYVNEQGLGSPGRWIYSPEVVAALSSIDIGGDEQLTINLGGVNALLESRGADKDWARLRQLVALARILPAEPSPTAVDPQKLPEDLRPLVPLLLEWGKSDDVDRADLIQAAETDLLQQLVDRGRPHLTRIAQFLGQTEVQDSREAAALDDLAQAVMEAQQELRKRAGQRS